MDQITKPALLADSITDIIHAFHGHGWFDDPGAYVLVDGAFGSTGKGAAAILLGLAGRGAINIVTTNAGPNSGHTGFRPISGEKILTQQIPVAAVLLRDDVDPPMAYLNGGAIVDPVQLMNEAAEYRFNVRNLRVHPCATVIEEEDRRAEADVTSGAARIASTGKGVGAALARKINRRGNVARSNPQHLSFFSAIRPYDWNWNRDVVLVETAQGFSLGINSHQFYPATTSRECTVMQAIADARIPVRKVRKVIMTVRTYPIRVGNTDAGNSGAPYSDQREIGWEALGVEPELTTVTKRVRRIFTWSRSQFKEAVAANQPDVIWVGFADYLQDHERQPFIDNLLQDYQSVMNHQPEFLIGSFGPKPEDARIL